MTTYYYTLKIGTPDSWFYLSPKTSIAIEEESDFESLTLADSSCGCNNLVKERTFKFKVHFVGNCSLASAWALRNQLEAKLALSCTTDLLLYRRVEDETPLVYKITKYSTRMIDTVNQFTQQHILTIELILTLSSWPLATDAGIIKVTSGSGSAATSIAASTVSPHIVGVNVVAPTFTLVNNLNQTPKAVAVTLVQPLVHLDVAVLPLAVVVTMPVLPLQQPAGPFAIAVTLKTPYVGGLYQHDVLSNAGLVGYWRLNETTGTVAADRSSYADDGSYAATPTLNQAGPLSKWADSLGVKLVSTSTVSIPDANQLDVGDIFTFECFYKRTTTGVVHDLVSKGNGPFSVGFYSDDTIFLGKPFVNYLRRTVATFTDTTKWHHLVVTKTGSTIHIYVDGVDKTLTSIADATLTNNSHALVLGIDGDDSSNHATDDYLSEVALYSTVLSGATVTTHYNDAVTDGLV